MGSEHCEAILSADEIENALQPVLESKLTSISSSVCDKICFQKIQFSSRTCDSSLKKVNLKWKRK
jgi:hypothetical protein